MRRSATAACVRFDAVGIERPIGRRLLGGLDLELAPGSWTCIAGANGTGKTSLALAVTGLLPGSVPGRVTGRILLDGAPLDGLGGAERCARIAAVRQDPDSQLVARTVRDELRLTPEHLLLPEAEIERRVEAAAALAGIGPELGRGRGLDADPMRCSGGERQRIALAAALTMRPRLLVLDEPTARLDAASAAAFVAALARARAEHEMTILVIDHRLERWLEHADRLLVLDRAGRVRADGRPAEIVAQRAGLLAECGVRVPGRPLREPHRCSGGTASAASARSAPRSASALEIEGLRSGRRGARRLDGVSATIPAGEVVALRGPNGAGKTSLLRALAGERIAGGRIRPGTRERRRRGIGVAFDPPDAQLLEPTALAVLARPFGGDPVAARRLLERVGLGRMPDEPPLRLSGGLRQRLAVAQAFAGDPALVLLDEPTSAQDLDGIDVILGLVEERAPGTTVVIASHDDAFLAACATAELELAAGRVPPVVRPSLQPAGASR